MKDSGRTGFHLIIGTAATGIVFEFSYNLSEWKADYKKIGTGKFDASVRTGLPIGILLDQCPELLKPDDPNYRGSWVKDQFITSISGLEQEDDESHSKSITEDICFLLEEEINSLCEAYRT